MKKLFLSLVAAMMATTATFAQSSLLATLSHEGTISTYYGASALRDAYTAAVDGDIITLSSGSFSSINIEKALTIRGAGMAVDETAQTQPTVITGDFNISIPDEATSKLTIEGIYHNHTITLTDKTLKNATFLKCRLNKFTYNINGDGRITVTNLTMINCKIVDRIDFEQNSSASFVNCVVCNPYINGNSSKNPANIEYFNSVVIKGEAYRFYLGYSQFKNCILVALSNYDSGNSNYLESSNLAYNCVAVGLASNMFKNIPNTTDVVKEYAEVFKTYTGTYTDNELFELTDEAKTTLLGLEGTQVGIYGGSMPFSSTPTNPQITKCNVASKSTADGKLSVDITVNGAE